MFMYLLDYTEDEQFEADKAQVMKEIAALEPKDHSWAPDCVK